MPYGRKILLSLPPLFYHFRSHPSVEGSSLLGVPPLIESKPNFVQLFDENRSCSTPIHQCD
ncbi:unnamed protein product [Rodentolepis nana]|uniref:Uncharacterized protein n=1 Tax=Rodentolepis nana TaxID=102285 RepID=A0A3P7W401_RODNA|nr:unnamed protein product [Rodentolepis nana]